MGTWRRIYSIVDLESVFLAAVRRAFWNLKLLTIEASTPLGLLPPNNGHKMRMHPIQQKTEVVGFRESSVPNRHFLLNRRDRACRTLDFCSKEIGSWSQVVG